MVEQLGEQDVEVEGAGEALGDFQDDFEFANGVLNEKAEVGAAGANLAADDQALVGDHGGGRHAKPKQVRSDLQRVIFGERRALANASAVEVCAVATAQVFDEE